MADLIERLRAVESGEEGTNWYRNPDGPEAAARIAELEAEVARRDSLLAEVKGGIIEGTAYDVAAWEARRAALAAPDTGGADGE